MDHATRATARPAALACRPAATARSSAALLTVAPLARGGAIAASVLGMPRLRPIQRRRPRYAAAHPAPSARPHPREIEDDGPRVTARRAAELT